MDEKKKSGDSLEDEKFRRIFIGGLSQSTQDSTIKKYFSKFGEVAQVDIKKDNSGLKSRGFGFMIFARAESVDKVQASRPHTIDGQKLKTSRAVPRELFGKPELHMHTKAVFISRLNDNVEIEDLLKYFRKFGKVVMAKVDVGKKSGKKYGVVEFSDSDPIDKIILEWDHFLNGSRIDVMKHFTPDEQAYLRQVKDTYGPFAWKNPSHRRKNITGDDILPSSNYNFIGEGGGYDHDMQDNSDSCEEFQQPMPLPKNSLVPSLMQQKTGGGPLKGKFNSSNMRSEPYSGKGYATFSSSSISRAGGSGSSYNNNSRSSYGTPSYSSVFGSMSSNPFSSSSSKLPFSSTTSLFASMERARRMSTSSPGSFRSFDTFNRYFS